MIQTDLEYSEALKRADTLNQSILDAGNGLTHVQRTGRCGDLVALYADMAEFLERYAMLGDSSPTKPDAVNRPSHYNSHPSKVETRAVTRWFSGMLAAAVKYVWRAGMKDSYAQDMRKAAWCFRDEKSFLIEYPNEFGSTPFRGPGWKKEASKVVLFKPPPDPLARILVILIASTRATIVSALEECAKICDDEAALVADGNV